LGAQEKLQSMIVKGANKEECREDSGNSGWERGRPAGSRWQQGMGDLTSDSIN